MLVLASTSPRRIELLQGADVDFTTLSVVIDETWQAGELPDDYIVRMVQSKALKASERVATALVLTADTIGVLDGEVLTKPKDKADAFRMWDKLSNNTHQIWTAVCVSDVQNGQIVRQQTIKVATAVTFVELTDQQKERYWASGEPVDKAGAYAIQGGAMAWVKSITGSYTNVVGLPLAQTLALLDGFNNHTSCPKAF
ncbi:MAG: Maf family protein [Moraxella sp.]|nr:Maf family protein [Moraxella sp.]